MTNEYFRKKTLGDRLREARELAGLTQAKLAEKSGISQQQIAKIEVGKTKKTTYITYLAKILAVSPDWLAEERGPMRKEIGERINLTSKKIPFIYWSDFNAGQNISRSDIVQILLRREQEQEVYSMDCTEKEILGRLIAALRAENIDAMQPSFNHPLAINSSDYLAIDFDKKPKNGSLVLAKEKNGIVIRQYIQDGNKFILKALNPQYPIIEDFEVLGVIFKIISEIE